MPARSPAPPPAPRQAQGSRLSENARVRAALDWFTPNISWINDQQARITEIPAPPFQEAQRAGAVKELLADSGLEIGRASCRERVWMWGGGGVVRREKGSG